MGLEVLVYRPLMEDEHEIVKSWDKDTINYIINNEKKTKNHIKGMLGKRYRTFVDSNDVEDIYSELLLCLFKAEDYNINRAIVNKDDGKGYIVSLESYILKTLDFCIKRFVTNKYNKEHLMVNIEITTSEDTVLDLLETVADQKSAIEFENTIVDLKQHCENCLSIRYKYGIDIYQMWYAGLLAIHNKKENVYFHIMNTLGVSKRDLKDIGIKAFGDETIIEFALGINKLGIEKSIEIIKPYVYSADIIENAINSISLID